MRKNEAWNLPPEKGRDRVTRAIVQDLDDPATGQTVFDRFKGGKAGTLGYYEAIVQTFKGRGAPMSPALDAVVGRMHDRAASTARKPLTV